jgi:methionyl-tRNA synthetase
LTGHSMKSGSRSAKEKDSDHLREVLAYLSGSLLEIAGLLEPFLPDTAAKIQKAFAEGIVRPSETTLFPKQDVAEKA